MREQAKVLIVEDDTEIARVICDYLRKQGYVVTWASTGKEGWEDFHHDTFDMILVDLMLPEMDGFTLCKTIRLESDVPLLIVSARHEDESKVLGLGLGADDYITKPFSLEELSARINSHLRRFRRYQGKLNNDRVLEFEHNLKIDFSKQTVYLDNKPLLLTAKEQALLFLLAKNPERTFSKTELYEHVWQQDDVDGNNTVTVHIKSLRSKLNDQSRKARFIQTVWGIGYRFIGVPA